MPLLDPALPSAGSPVVKWGKLYGAAAALAIAEAAAKAAGPLIVITPNSRDAEALSEEIGFFAGSRTSVRVFPDLETLPYDAFSAHPDITSARLATLAELPRARHGVWLVAIDTLLQRLAPRSYIEAYSLKVHVGETLDLEALRARLALAGYAAVTQVVAHGEFAVRGSLLDVFPMGSDTPYRIDLLDRDVDSIRHFDPDTPALGRQAGADSAAARARNAAQSRRGARISPPLSPALRGRPDRTGGLPRRERRTGAGRPRVLPAAVLRAHLAPVRVPAARQRP